MPRTSSIGDRVWLDRDADGVQDAGEPGLNGVTLVVVYLGPDGKPGGDDVSYDAITDGDGDWRVSGIPAGKYVVTVTGGLPSGVTPTYDADSSTSTPDQTSMVVIDGDENDQDFGYAHRAAIGDVVFSDNNRNGVQDAREYGAWGIEIRVTDLGADGARGGGDDTVVGTYTTNSLGDYLAPDLLDGTYAVDVVGGLPDGVEFTVDPQGTDGPDGMSITTISNGRDDLTQDFGYTPTVVGNNTIGDTVFHDANRNGIDDGAATDPRLANVGIEITFLGENREVGGGDDVVIGTFFTDDDGRYEATGLPDGRYLVEVVSGIPAGFEPTVDPQGTDDPDGMSTVTLANESTNRDQDFGYAGSTTGLGSIGDRVYLDTNLDGVQGDPDDEPGLSGVRVVLTAPGSDGEFGSDDDVVDERTTDGLGNYLFDDLPAGDYSVAVDESTIPAPLRNTDDEDGDNDGSTQVSLGDSDDHLTADFGYGTEPVELGSIGDRIYLDTNGDGVQGDPDDEPGLGGVIVRLTSGGPDGELGNGDDVVTEQETDADGNYLFDDLPANDYRIDVVGGVVNRLANTDDPDGGGDSSSLVSLGDGEDRTDQDFGYDPGDPADAFLGDRVWFDANRNGVQEAGEPGINGVTITLTLPDGSTRGTVTSGDGDYLFTDLEPGEYTVTVGDGLPAGLVATYDADDRLVAPDGESTTELVASDLDQDFGYVGTGSIGDTISLVQGGEPIGIPGVIVTVTDLGLDGEFGTDDDTDYVRVTDADGRYLVTGLPAGDYQVDVDERTLPDGVEASGDPDGVLDSSSSVALSAGENDLDQDFSYVGVGRIGDTIYLDTNGDGTQGDPADEPGIAGVTVRLTATDSDLVLTTTTDDNGNYLFDGLPAGEYTVEVLGGLPAGVANTDDPDGPAEDGDSTSVVTIGAGPDDNEDLDQDFGYDTVSLLGDRVWLDLDRDGVQDAGEPGINGVTITATTAAGESFETTTDGDGDYLFTDLVDGTYTVAVTGGVPAGLEPTFDADSGLVDVDETSTTDLVASDLDQDFGYVGTGSIGDTIFEDADVDGTQGDGEAGIPGVVVTVTGAGQDGEFGTSDDIMITTITDDAGNYTADGLPAGDYLVSIDDDTLPAGSEVVTDPDDIADGTSSVTLAPGETNDDQDFGVAVVGSIGDTIYLDANGDGEQGDPADEPGLAGVTVTLTDDDGEVRTTTTDDNGNYLFDGLPAGDYTVEVTGGLPDNVANTGDPDGDADGGDLGDSTSSVTLLPGADDLDQDFGYRADSLLGDRVWFDRNRDGVQDPDEPGINGVTVTAINAAGETFTTTTDGDGDYLFTELTDGAYTVTVTAGIPSGFGPTADFDTAADGSNTVGDETSTTDLVTADLDQDFGYAGDSSLGEIVWLDLDGDGVLDDGEAGLPGVGVIVTWAGPDGEVGTDDDIVFDAVTGENGEYLVDGLPAGTYVVAVDESTLPAGAEQTYGLAGGNESPQPSVQVSLPAGTDRDDADFGFDLGGGATIGDTVWLDLDADGIRDLGEPGLTGATVTATYLGADGAPGGGDDQVFTTTVDDAGNYLFEDIPAGTYDIRITNLPDGMFPTADPDGGDDNASRVTVGLDEEDLDQDFGYVGSAGVGDEIFIDLDGDGVRDPNEPGIEGVTVTVTSAGADGEFGTDDDIVVITTTDDDGRYVVEGLPAGATQVTYDADDLPEGVQPLGDLDGGDPTSTVVTLNSGETIRDVDYPVGGDGVLCGTIFDDIDGDGVQDAGEAGVPGVTVEVTWAGPDGDVILLVVTDANGDWCLENLPPGDYSVEVDPTTLPPGTTGPTGPKTVVLGVGGNEDIDVGTTPTGGVFGGVFNDTNGNGQRDPGETGAPDVTVILVAASGEEAGRTTTDTDGNYEFENLPPGTYTVIVDPATVPRGTTIISETDGQVDGRTTVVVTPGRVAVGGGFGVGSERVAVLPTTGSNGTSMMLRVAFTVLLAGLALAMFRRRDDGVPDTTR